MQPSVKVGACPSLLISPAPLPRFAGWDWSSPRCQAQGWAQPAHRIFLLIGRFSQSLDCREHCLSRAPQQGTLARAATGGGTLEGGPLPPLILCLVWKPSTTMCPTVNPRSCPSSLGLSCDLESLAGTLASPRRWPPTGSPITRPSAWSSDPAPAPQPDPAVC